MKCKGCGRELNDIPEMYRDFSHYQPGTKDVCFEGFDSLWDVPPPYEVLQYFDKLTESMCQNLKLPKEE